MREENERIKPAPVIDTLTQVYTPTPNGVYTSVLCTCIRRVKDAICIRSSDVSTFAPHWRLWYSLSVVGPFIRIRTVNIKRSGLRLGEREGETGGVHTRVSRLGRDRAVSFHPTATLIVTRVPPLLHFLFSLPNFHYFHYSERSRSEISNFGIGSISILDLNSRESVLGRVWLIEVKRMVEDSITGRR